MPELPEVESYRRLAEAALGRTVASVVVHDPRFLRGGLEPRGLRRAVVDRRLVGARRRGKLLVLDVDGDRRLGLRFGMTGRLFVDGDGGGVDRLLYSSRRPERIWDRLTLRFADGGRLVVHDPRLLGGASLDPAEDALGPDALGLSRRELADALAASAVALKARLLDQSKVAGVGNLIADELLWRASLAPGRPAGSLSPVEVRRLHHHLGRTLAVLIARGGSHTGDLVAERRPGGVCPRCATALRRSTVGARTTWWCPGHQR